MFFWREQIQPSGDAFGVGWAVTDRSGGSSLGRYATLNLGGHVGDREGDVETNRRRLAGELGLSTQDLRFMDQQHGCGVAFTADLDPIPAPTVDALISDNSDEALVVMVADCVPVLLVDRTEGLVAAVHAGRPGMVGGVVPATLAKLRELGAGDVEAVVGPSVCARCYEVPASMRDAAADVEPVSAALSWTGTPAIDVAAGVVAQLVRGGVSVRWLPGCTREDPNLYSYRRDGQTGRFAGVVRLIAPEWVA
ncbi:polyphenol oxidase family protein [Ornithinimicrobium cerasi]|uniref:polyphenol oxidase family protein n=1 Tax=Ornithinimicrobium cerasi TaxID=2248773 RepID=UPI000EFF3D42|nr:polyphenol oxidase family protein [Ornithinimicrobium cerasi]